MNPTGADNNRIRFTSFPYHFKKALAIRKWLHFTFRLLCYSFIALRMRSRAASRLEAGHKYKKCSK